MNTKNTAITNNLGRLLVVCAVAFAFDPASALASDKTKKSQAISPISAYSTKPANNAKAEKALEFTISKSMGKTMNAIQWTFGASKIGRPVLSGNQYQLVNMAIEKGLKHQKRTTAGNLGFQDISSRNYNVLVQRQKGNGQLRYGDIVALNLRPYGWLRYKKRGYGGGINIGDDNHNPHYIWKVTGGKNGAKVYSGMPFALYNTKPQKTEVIFCQRTYGIDLGWRGVSDCDSTVAKYSGKVFGVNGALSGDGLTGKLAKDWKDKLCKAGVAAVSGAVVGGSGGVTSAAAAAATPVAIKKCNAL
jgi:hypothetical protein